MAPTRQKKARKSTESTTSVDMMTFPAPPSEMTPAKTRSPAKTPTSRSPIKKPGIGKLSLAQKQQLIDNLQQEVTERARRLRQQYSAQAQDLRIRIERRVTRIPMHLRRANMGDLLRKYNETTGSSRQATATSSKNTLTITKSPSKNILGESRSSRQSPAPPQRGAKRHSDAMSVTDKENEDTENPRKRVRSPPLPPSRTTSQRRLNQYPQVLSPKSSNTRSQATKALGPVPVRPMNSSPVKPHLTRPISRGKPAGPVPAGGAASILSNMVEKAKSSRAGGTRKVTEPSSSASNASAPVGRARRGAAQPARPATRNGRGRVSDGSETSTATTGTTGTTVIRRAAAPAPAKKEPAKRTVMGTLKGMRGEASKKLPAAPKPAATTAAGGRVLRKRN